MNWSRSSLISRNLSDTNEPHFSLAPEERHQIYKTLKVRVTTYPDAQLEVGGILASAPGVCSRETSRA